MNYKIRKTKDGKFNAVIVNSFFNLETVYKFDTREDAQDFINAQIEERKERLSSIPTLSDYFGKAGK